MRDQTTAAQGILVGALTGAALWVAIYVATLL
jgi:hypothetical protein